MRVLVLAIGLIGSDITGGAGIEARLLFAYTVLMVFWCSHRGSQLHDEQMASEVIVTDFYREAGAFQRLMRYNAGCDNTGLRCH